VIKEMMERLLEEEFKRTGRVIIKKRIETRPIDEHVVRVQDPERPGIEAVGTLPGAEVCKVGIVPRGDGWERCESVGAGLEISKFR
jgi:hypothetical protein